MQSIHDLHSPLIPATPTASIHINILIPIPIYSQLRLITSSILTNIPLLFLADALTSESSSVTYTPFTKLASGCNPLTLTSTLGPMRQLQEHLQQASQASPLYNLALVNHPYPSRSTLKDASTHSNCCRHR